MMRFRFSSDDNIRDIEGKESAWSSASWLEVGLSWIRLESSFVTSSDKSVRNS